MRAVTADDGWRCSSAHGLMSTVQPDIEQRDEGRTASPLSAPAHSCLLNYTSVQPLPLFSLPSSLPNLIRESADAVCARLM